MLAFLDKISFGTPLLRRVAFWLLTAFILYVFLGFVVLPPVAKKILVSQANQALHRTTTLEDVAFNPFTLEFDLVGLHIAKKEGEGEILSVGTFRVAPGLSSITELAPVIRYLELTDLKVDVTFFGDGKYSFSDLIPAPTPETAQETEPQQPSPIFPFALYGFKLNNASIIFDDRTHDKRHEITDINLCVPFTASIMDLREEFTQPEFTAVVNGDPIKLTGRTLPFHNSLRTEFDLGAVDVDLNQYWRYLPVKSPLQLTNGQFTSDISLFFERPDDKQMALYIGGSGRLHDLVLTAPGEGKVLTLKSLDFQLDRFSLGDNRVVVNDITLEAPMFKLVRRENGEINWTRYFPSSELVKGGAAVKTEEESAPILVEVKAFHVKGGSLQWNDKAIEGGFQRTIGGIAVNGTGITTEKGKQSSFSGAIGTEEKLTFSGNGLAVPVQGDFRVDLTGLDVTKYKTYMDAYLPLAVNSGILALGGQVHLATVDDAVQVKLDDGGLTLENLAISKPGMEKSSIELGKLAVTSVSLDPVAQVVHVPSVTLTDPTVRLVRKKNGNLDLVDLMAEASPEAPASEAGADKEQAANQDEDAKAWAVTVDTVAMDNGEFGLVDLTPTSSASFRLVKTKATLSGISTNPKSTISYDLSSHWGAGGTIQVKGDLNQAPMATKGSLRIAKLNLRPLDPYLGDFSELMIAKGSASANIAYDAVLKDTPEVTVSGDAALNDINIQDGTVNGKFAALNAMELKKINLTGEPYKLKIGEIRLDAPSAVVALDKDGRSNIERVLRVKSDEESKKEEPKETAKDDSGAPLESVVIGRIVMANGSVAFRDASVKPPFSTSLNNMTLTLKDVRQAQDARPEMDFSARLGPTPLSVRGVANPISDPIYSDLVLTVDGMELVPLTPYTIKNLAYPIEKGRLYADVAFMTDNNELSAKNKFFIQQLVLGPRDKTPGAPDVPVKFGLSLLQDSNGDLTLNLPISGNLDDPDFHIGGIVFKAIVSLLFKALASPFSIIGSIFDGGPDNMDFVLFDPGRHELTAKANEKVASLAKVMEERTRIQLEVDGLFDPTRDEKGLRQKRFEDLLKQAKYDDLTRKERGKTTVEAMVISDEEYKDVLYQVYKDTPDENDVRPTTLFIVDEQPVDVMEQFVLDHIAVTGDDLQELANQRARTVKDAFIAIDPGLSARLFLLDRKGGGEKVGVPMHRVDINIK